MKTCRICFEEDNGKNLISPCLCKGSMHAVHLRCMEQWIKFKELKMCEVCHAKLNITLKFPSIPVVIYRLMKSLWNDKKRLLKIVLLIVFGQFLYKRLISLKADFRSFTSSRNRGWIKMFGLGALFGAYYAQLLIVFLKETIEMIRSIIRIIKDTAHMTIGDYNNL